MRPYQITLILKDQKDTTEIDKTISEMGEILKNQPVGQRPLVYPIKKQTTGYFYKIDASLPAEKIQELHQTLLRQPAVLRCLLTSVPTLNPPTPAKSVDKAIRQLAEKEATKAIEAKPIKRAVKLKKVEEKPLEADIKERQKLLDEKLKELLKE